MLAICFSFGLWAPAALAQPVDHESHTAADHELAGTFVLRGGPDGLVCAVATASDLPVRSRASGEPMSFTLVPSTNAERDIVGLRILLRATDQLLEFPDALLAFRRSAARWGRAITTPITVVVDVDYGPENFGSPYDPSILGSTSSALQFLTVGPAEIVAKLKAQHPGDAQLQALYDGIPIPTPSTASGQNLGNAVVNLVQAQVFGYAPSEMDPDPIVNPLGNVPAIGFNSAFPYDFEPADGIASGLTDFEGVAVHELGHALGFTSIIGSGGPPDNYFTTWDLFRVRPGDVEPGEDLDDGAGWETAPRVTTPGPPDDVVLAVEGGTVYYQPVQVFFDGLKELPVSTATGQRTGGDGQQASHWRDNALRPPSLGADRKIGIMDPDLASGVRDEYTDNDLRVLEVLGFNVLYEPAFAKAKFTVQGNAYDVAVTDSLEFENLGNVAVGVDGTLVVEIQNTDSAVELDYEAEIDIELAYPTGVAPAASFTASGPGTGTVAPGSTRRIEMAIRANQPGVFFGTLRVETNVNSALVVEIPFRVSVGGVTAPQLVASSDDLGDLGNIEPPATATETFTVSNAGSLDLNYRATVSLARRPIPFSTTPDVAARGVAPLFSEDFEDGTLGGFAAGGSFPGDWQVIDIGPATLGGHSQPNAAYFGQSPVGSGASLQYRNLATGLLVSPSIDLSAVPQEDLVVLSFNTFLQAEEGFDFASVLVSFDDGNTYQEVATSDDGVLQNTEAWEEITIDLPILSGYPAPVRFAFKFVSDTFVTDIGWLIDDVVLTTRPGENPAFVTPIAQTLGDDGSQELTLTIRGSELDRGFYRGSVVFISNSLEFSDAGVPVGFLDEGIRVIQASESIPFTFTVAGPAFPTLAVADDMVLAAVRVDRAGVHRFEVTNEGDAPLTFIRVLEPALSQYMDDREAAARVLKPTVSGSRQDVAGLEARRQSVGEAGRKDIVPAGRGPASDSLGSAIIPAVDAWAGDIAQLGDGRIAVLEILGTRVFVYEEEFYGAGGTTTPTIYTLPSFFSGQNPTSLLYNEDTESLWLGVFQRTGLYELTLPAEGTELVRTGRAVELGFQPSNADYSPELGAFFVIEWGTTEMHAFGLDGEELPGYPVFTYGVSFFRGLSLTGGLAEIGYQDLINTDSLSYATVDQFSNPFAGTSVVLASASLLGGAERINALLRSRTQPNEVMYYVSEEGNDGNARLVAVDPPDLPERYTQTPLDAGVPLMPLYGKELAPGASTTLSFDMDGEALGYGTARDTLVFLTNNPDDRIVRIPVEIDVYGVANEGAATPKAFALHQNYPNPFAGQTRLAFDLPTAERVTLAVYDVLGKRVAVLADDEPMEAGTAELPFDASGLASGTYVVRLQAGDYTGTQRLTVVN